MEVYPNIDAAVGANPPEPEGDEISFLKEQAWKIDFAIEQVKRQSIREVIHTSGEIQPAKGEEKIITAKSSTKENQTQLGDRIVTSSKNRI